MIPPFERTTPTAPPPILTAAAELLAGYDVIFCDVWGVVHNGYSAYLTACDALVRFRQRGGSVVLLSNAPVPNDAVATMLDGRGVPADAYDVIVSSGDIALAHVAESGLDRVHTIGPARRDAALFSRLTARAVPLENAQAIVCTGLVDDERETAESYRPLLREALSSRLPFVCANPDLVVDVGGRHYLCAGAIAALYEEMGGSVYWAGKPHRVAYDSAEAQAKALRNGDVDRRRILAIGDAMRTDIAGAAGAGLDALFIGAGIHRHDTMTGSLLDAEKLAKLFAPETPPAVGAMAVLAW